jgi:hypothetical protein
VFVIQDSDKARINQEYSTNYAKYKMSFNCHSSQNINRFYSYAILVVQQISNNKVKIKRNLKVNQ